MLISIPGPSIESIKTGGRFYWRRLFERGRHLPKMAAGHFGNEIGQEFGRQGRAVERCRHVLRLFRLVAGRQQLGEGDGMRH